MGACANGQTAIASLLLQRGADINRQSNVFNPSLLSSHCHLSNFLSAEWLECSYGCLLLRSHCHRLPSPGEGGGRFTERQCQTHRCSSLLSFNSQNGKTALDIARENLENECAEVLERHFVREVSRSQHPSLPNPALFSLSFTLFIPWPASCNR
jgi:ankyrin repeat protein